MARLRHIYVVATPDRDSSYVSVGRSWTDPSQIAAFASAREAILAEAAGEVCVPGYFIGDASPTAMSSLTVEELHDRLVALGYAQDGAPARVATYQGVLELWAEGSMLWLEELPAAKLADLRELFDRHADPAVVGERAVYKIEVE